MDFLSDILLAGSALVAALYCLVLSRRLRKFTNLEDGVGKAVTTLAGKADELDKTLKAAQYTAAQSVTKLDDVSNRAEAAARHLELLVASLHSLPDAAPTPAKKANPFRAGTTQNAGNRL